MLNAIDTNVLLRRIARDDPVQTPLAKAAMAEGADFADMLHVANAKAADKFLTFDRDLHRTEGKIARLTVEILTA